MYSMFIQQKCHVLLIIYQSLYSINFFYLFFIFKILLTHYIVISEIAMS